MIHQSNFGESPVFELNDQTFNVLPKLYKEMLQLLRQMYSRLHITLNFQNCRVSTYVGKPDDRGCHEKISQAPKHFASKNTIKSLLLD